MRIIALAAAAALVASAAVAAPASVHVSIGPAMEKKADKTYGVAEVDRLAATLKRDVERRLGQSGALQDARVELVLVDAQANRPTMKQMSDRPGLSFSSFGVGGARIEGKVIAADGAVRPVSYAWYESDIHRAWGDSTWHDAEWTFDRFASRLSRGQDLASR